MCRQRLRRDDFSLVPFDYRNMCQEHCEDEATKACVECMQLLCAACVSSHNTTHTLCQLSEAAKLIQDRIAPTLSELVDEVTLAHYNAEAAVTTDFQCTKDNILHFGENMEKLIDSFIGNLASNGTQVTTNHLQTLWQCMSHNIQQFGVKIQEHGTSELDTSKDNHHERIDDSASSNNRTLDDSSHNTDEDSTSLINTSTDDDFIDDMLYGLVDDDFEDDDEDSDNINFDYEEDDDE